MDASPFPVYYTHPLLRGLYLSLRLDDAGPSRVNSTLLEGASERLQVDRLDGELVENHPQGVISFQGVALPLQPPCLHVHWMTCRSSSNPSFKPPLDAVPFPESLTGRINLSSPLGHKTTMIQNASRTVIPWL